MGVKIAVFIQDKFRSALSETMMRTIVFEQSDGVWNQIEEYYVNLSPGADVGTVREEIKKLLERLDNCRIVAGSSFSGVLYRELDSRGFSIFEVDEFSPGTLDSILRDIDEARIEAGLAADAPTHPIEMNTTGVYQLDLVKLQKANPEISSKQALCEFLETTPFYELRLVCAHVPPWLMSGSYDISTETAGDVVAATIRKKQCRGGG